ncbi:alanyl-tRNA editing protein [Bosea sp. UC22_33]|uniref:alanyl-tRNA editing protein n=1 Tax=Bosea sp. UC22_33 TaxID=3350165 RepID=UPI00367292F4
MLRPFYLDHPDMLHIEAIVLDAQPGAVLIKRSPVFPGGGGQLADRAMLTWSGGTAPILGTSSGPTGVWHRFDGDAAPYGLIRIDVDRSFRNLMCELHTLAHMLNALVYTRFGGALLTGAQLSADGSFRVDFDLPGADSERLRALEGALNDVIASDLPVMAGFMLYEKAKEIDGMFRSKSVAPPPSEDGTVRIVEIAGLDRQACGGTHLASTGQARPARIVKIDNKGRQNRRIKVAV